MLFKKWFSYLFPWREATYESPFSGRLEINWQQGKRVLDTSVSNYSYGSLQRILQCGLQEAGFQPMANNVLLLGLGGGSLIETLRNFFAYKGQITCVEIDPVVIQIAREVFDIERFAPLTIICQDATTYVAGCTSRQSFDWIVVDIFIGNTIPQACTHANFLTNLTELLSEGGKLLFNTMQDTLPLAELAAMESHLQQNCLKTRILRNVEQTNNLLLAEKLTNKP